jgi:hypothetical protein
LGVGESAALLATPVKANAAAQIALSSVSFIFMMEIPEFSFGCKTLVIASAERCSDLDKSLFQIGQAGRGRPAPANATDEC